MERATETQEKTKPQAAQGDDLCRICNTPRCTVVCPRRVKQVVAKLLLIGAIVHLDATADPAIARQNHALDCERGVIYYTSPAAYQKADTVAP
jgi:hypothetical protein